MTSHGLSSLSWLWPCKVAISGFARLAKWPMAKKGGDYCGSIIDVPGMPGFVHCSGE